MLESLASATLNFDGLGPVRLGSTPETLRQAGIEYFDDDCGIRFVPRVAPHEVSFGVSDEGVVVRVDLALLPDYIPTEGVAREARVLGGVRLGDDVDSAAVALEAAGAKPTDLGGYETAWELVDEKGRILIIGADGGVLRHAWVGLSLAVVSESYCE